MINEFVCIFKIQVNASLGKQDILRNSKCYSSKSCINK